MRLLGIEFMKKEQADALRESDVNFSLAKREMEEIGWTLLSAPWEQQTSDIKVETRQRAHTTGIKYWLQDPLVGQTVDMYTDYTIGPGISTPQTDNEKLQAVFERFWNDPDNSLVLTSADAQRTKSKELQLAGNVFLTAFVNEGTGRVKLSDIPPGEIVDIITDPDNRKRHLYYKRKYTPVKFDFKSDAYTQGDTVTQYFPNWRFSPRADFRPGTLESAKVFHLYTNRLSDGKFGNPRTMRILEWVRAYNEFMKSRVSLMQALSMFAWRRKVKGNPADVRRIASAWATRQTAGGAPTTNPVPTGMVPPPPQYAAMVTQNDAVSLDPIKTDTGASGALQDGRQLKGQIGVGTGFPLHYLGDIGGSNLATSTAMELPILKMCEAEQGMWLSNMRNVLDYVIACAIKYGDLPAAKGGRFTQERVDEMFDDGFADGFFESSHAQIHTDRGEYEYKAVLPSILKRQVSETVNATVNALKAVDPYGDNIDASRWALQFVLEVLGESNPQAVVSKVFPPGYEPPVRDDAAGGSSYRGRTDHVDGDGRGQTAFKKQKKLPSEQAVGVKGGKRARQPGEIATSTVEAALLDAVDAAFDHIDEAMSADDA